jgi:hypothetical protein
MMRCDLIDTVIASPNTVDLERILTILAWYAVYGLRVEENVGSCGFKELYESV